MVTSEEMREASDKLEELADIEDEETNVKNELSETTGGEIKLSFLSNGHVLSEIEEIHKISTTLNINATDARKQLTFPKEYNIDGQTIPDLVRKMRKARRQLKGDMRDKMAKSIDALIDGYSDYLDTCIKSMHWISPYSHPLKKMSIKEKDLFKLNKMKDTQLRREVVDVLCKYWELDIKQKDMAYGKEYAEISKSIKEVKKEYKGVMSKISSQQLVKSKKELAKDYILKQIINNPGIAAKGLHDGMPNNLHRYSNSNMISKMARSMPVTNYDGSYYKVPSMLMKNIWAYTAAFIDSDGYITMDRNMNPRVGLVATGERGKAFMQEMHKSIGYGRMHLDQKSPQDTRLINRLNFYSQADVTDLLTKCLPHFRLKKGNANLLLELIRMKKSYKKAEWYKPRCEEIFKLMKWENHKDHVGFDWSKEGIYLDDITKLQGNCKMSTMDSLENIGGIITKSSRAQIEQSYPRLKQLPDEAIKEFLNLINDRMNTSPAETIITRLYTKYKDNIGLFRKEED